LGHTINKSHTLSFEDFEEENKEAIASCTPTFASCTLSFFLNSTNVVARILKGRN